MEEKEEKTYYLYHIPGKKIGVTRNLNKRVKHYQGYNEGEYEIIWTSNDINIISAMELEYQALYGYKVDRQSYKNLISKHEDSMKENVTEQTITFPVPVNMLRNVLEKNIGEHIEASFGKVKLDRATINWIMQNVRTSMYNDKRCYVYNKALEQFLNNPVETSVDERLLKPHQDFKSPTLTPLGFAMPKAQNVFDNIRVWARDKGIYSKGDVKTQTLKLVEEVGELSRGILKFNRDEVKDAIGDCVVVLTNLAHLSDMTIEECIESAYNVIKNRQGEMVNGTFVKSTL